MGWRASARQIQERRAETRRSTAARVLSIAGHPLLLTPLTVAFVTRSLRWTVLIGAATILPVTALILWNMHRGVWSDFDVSRRDQRSGLYWFALPLLALAALLLPAPPWFQRSMLALVAVLVIALALDRLLKTSLHLLFAAFSTVVMAGADVRSLALMLPLSAALAWSRWHLGHHTPAELALGSALGAAAGIETVWR